MEVAGTTGERPEISIEDRVCIEMSRADEVALRGKLNRVLQLSEKGGRQPAPLQFRFTSIYALTKDIQGILGMETEE